jgi:hypothetical protein
METLTNSGLVAWRKQLQTEIGALHVRADSDLCAVAIGRPKVMFRLPVATVREGLAAQLTEVNAEIAKRGAC